jgi:hypothetical protein
VQVVGDGPRDVGSFRAPGSGQKGPFGTHQSENTSFAMVKSFPEGFDPVLVLLCQNMLWSREEDPGEGLYYVMLWIVKSESFVMVKYIV